MALPPYDPYQLGEAGTRRAMDPSERVAAARAVTLLEAGLQRIGVPALAFLPINQPEREGGAKVWRLTAVGGHLRQGLTIPEATLNDPPMLDAFLRDHVPGAR